MIGNKWKTGLIGVHLQMPTLKAVFEMDHACILVDKRLVSEDSGTPRNYIGLFGSVLTPSRGILVLVMVMANIGKRR